MSPAIAHLRTAFVSLKLYKSKNKMLYNNDGIFSYKNADAYNDDGLVGNDDLFIFNY